MIVVALVALWAGSALTAFTAHLGGGVWAADTAQLGIACVAALALLRREWKGTKK